MALVTRQQAMGWLQRVQVPLQVALVMAIFIISEQLVSWLRLPLPANIVGMLLLLAMIVLRVLPLGWVKAGASWLLAEMLLFFIPAVVAVVNYADLLRVEGGRILLVIVISTLLVMAATSLVVDRVYRLEIWLAARKQGQRNE
ncbi:CidA/LrgA family protein [Erwinia amylovora]|uniref:CidA/LrgA family protein n=1 Tax=Erwinia amylovora TaxID=552 RepID=UPI0014441CF6|nr:CidA/LrgA family protein [Erwinia amylovora]